MPLIDIPQLELGQPGGVAVPKGFTITPGLDDINLGQDAPGYSQVWGAAFRQGNTIGSYIADENWGRTNQREEGFDGWKAIQGTKYERFWSSFVDVQNSGDADLVKRKIDREEDDRRTLATVPWTQSIPAQMVAGTLDWPTLLPGGAFVRAAGGGLTIAGVVKSAASVGSAAMAGTALQETGLHATQETRTPKETMENIGMAGVIGSGIGLGASVLLSGLCGATRAFD